jgi:hypothetical protein
MKSKSMSSHYSSQPQLNGFQPSTQTPTLETALHGIIHTSEQSGFLTWTDQ